MGKEVTIYDIETLTKQVLELFAQNELPIYAARVVLEAALRELGFVKVGLD